MELTMILFAQSARGLHFNYHSAHNKKVSAKHADNMAMVFDVENVLPDIR
jgi:hypothetical protein